MAVWESNTKKTKILHIITRGEYGGAQKHVYDMAVNLSREFKIHAAMGSRGFLWNQLSNAGIPVYHIPALTRAISPYMDLSALRQIIKLFKDIEPDLVCCHSSKAGLLGRLGARICGIPSIFTAHGWAFTDGVSEQRKRVYLAVERIATRWTNKIICVSEYDYRLALDCGVGNDGQLTVIHNGVFSIPNKYKASPEKENPLRIIMVARFATPKNHKLLIKALSGLKLHKEIEVDLVGDGPLLEECKDEARSLNMEDKVNFLGARPDVHKLLSRAQIFVLTSDWEGFPITILEAMRAGLPVITTAVGGTSESVVDGETGFLVPRGEVEILKDRLLRLINNPDLRLRMGQSSYRRFLHYFTFDHTLEKTKAVYDEILSNYDTKKVLQAANK